MATDEFPDSLADVLAGVHRLVRRRLRRGLTSPPLRGAQAELLRLVGARPGIRVSDAAKELYVAGNSVSTLVNQLTRAGYLTRESDPDDRRSVRLRLTPAAHERLRDWQTRRGELVRAQVARLSDEDRAALAAALPALRRLAGHLHEEVEGS
ncbi:MarR family transcriptional regulator [Streptomyces sp. NBC_01020]|uniref:MarR family winged helix-turn-helix transcriptional regulator n=1 Tax=unclassified Streptomyces TaxID=2593676 RepID=UPI00224CC045|nr:MULTISPECIES: MarR family transcriptional regulator [unclassified Streptomyces]MCX4723689.1 MarR family transcriptional regulator [Streptomyces sp. NBC_01306]WSV06725.1 MarR family transcriptional regulator [Streptomyces sp. NBC_01020]WSX44847.1 MarR family transcriptional regulator [Streptomyces sp. NBC_00963]WSX67137.1 MarR family transcriptional regulator [Streptomyces sp. NBC_00932]